MAGLKILTVEGAQMDGEPISLPESFPTLPADIWLISGVSPHMTRQLNGLGEYRITVLAGIHLPCSESQDQRLELLQLALTRGTGFLDIISSLLRKGGRRLRNTKALM